MISRLYSPGMDLCYARHLIYASECGQFPGARDPNGRAVAILPWNHFASTLLLKHDDVSTTSRLCGFERPKPSEAFPSRDNL